MNPLRILVVDDDAMLGEQLRSLLAVLGHQAVFSSDSGKALIAAQEQAFDLVFCDYWMPGAGGQTWFQQLVSTSPDLAPRVVFLTGGVLGEETQFFIRSKGNLQLLKPFRLPAIKQVLEAAIQSLAAPADPA